MSPKTSSSSLLGGALEGNPICKPAVASNLSLFCQFCPKCATKWFKLVSEYYRYMMECSNCI